MLDTLQTQILTTSSFPVKLEESINKALKKIRTLGDMVKRKIANPNTAVKSMCEEKRPEHEWSSHIVSLSVIGGSLMSTQICLDLVYCMLSEGMMWT